MQTGHWKRIGSGYSLAVVLCIWLALGGGSACGVFGTADDSGAGKNEKKGKKDKQAEPTGPPAALTITPIEFGEMNGKEVFNASGLVPLGDSKFLFCDNNGNDALYELNLAADGTKSGPVVRRPLQGIAPDAIDDMEDMALVEKNGTRYVVVASSMYIKEKKGVRLTPPSGLLRVTIGADSTLTTETMPGVRDWLVAAYPQLAAAAEKDPDAGGLNVEGLAFDRNRDALLFGLRTPVPGGRPLVLPVKIKDLAGSWTTDNLEALPAVALTLGPSAEEQGIRGLYADPTRDAIFVLTGNSTSASDAPFGVYTWNGGEDGVTTRLDVAFAKRVKAEGLTRGTVGGRGAFVFVDDAGGFKVVWGGTPPF